MDVAGWRDCRAAPVIGGWHQQKILCAEPRLAGWTVGLCATGEFCQAFGSRDLRSQWSAVARGNNTSRSRSLPLVPSVRARHSLSQLLLRDSKIQVLVLSLSLLLRHIIPSDCLSGIFQEFICSGKFHHHRPPFFFSISPTFPTHPC
jgi:hypothetical protein